jgi:hypothetical protein
MPAQNPVKAFTRSGKSNCLAALIAADAVFQPVADFAWLTQDAAVDPITEAISGTVAGTVGFGVGKEVTAWSATAVSDKGHVYKSSNLLTWTRTGAAVDESIKGVILSSAGALASGFIYIEFPDPVLLPDSGETLNIMLEIGFDGDEFYAKAHVIPLGE